MDDILDIGSEMNIKYTDLLDMTWKEYHYNYTGHQRRLERGWDYVRNIMASNYNSSGFSKKQVKPKDIMKLPNLDYSYVEFKMADEDDIQKLIDLAGWQM